MLFRTRRSRFLLWLAFGVLFGVVIAAPLAMVGLAAVAGTWNGVLPAEYTARHLADAASGDALASALVSVQTGLVASLAAVLVGTWAALAVRSAPRPVRRVVDTLLHLPVAVPSVVVGLSLLVAFSQPPLALNGTRWIVLVAHLVIVLPFGYGVVSGALDRADPALAEVAASLGAPPALVLWRVRLPLLAPALSASASLSLALSMGEVGATVMLYPPDWRTLPVSVFAQADRGEVFLAAASTVVLLGLTLVGLLTLGLAKGRAAER
ncbi:2-aminoethylphosphonate transport system permease protein [Streptoalloteichus tenebrarius]|uniref:2-aminoethylphosphonate transport system permease protein n=1 Tax=Streptoalloteichus tenebrarius (strain ATCC 17920 / DSM 40477 / JCM 4838 / CBS 697.72 / NBRC 16177 / NCIMB 11028 / NRRL B-12390 / A12253. 1 / ISP 5477) TaxID=1933 RepID=A0ABT1HMS1_STRSD|nr:ABC transporter permease subunit [Streptoalloteichus tenebrarius]MCP2256821.1 2-aminoethylphosphonate transport system permease protein [Streptoalloteichus tenebrarius]BFF00271.1 ABC transporter permease subunit [Streptoalloteichus tenebrarius]